MRTTIVFLVTSTLAFGAALAIAAPAQAQAVCEIPGAAGSEDTGGATAAGAGDFACGPNASADGSGGLGSPTSGAL
jgi:hypothetical protein